MFESGDMAQMPPRHLMVAPIVINIGQSDLQFLFLQDVAKLIKFCLDNNIKITGGELYRTYDSQLKHFKEGRSQTMNSDHLKRLAIDFNFFFNGSDKPSYARDDIRIVGEYWKSLRKGNYWGGDWESIDDAGHFGVK